MVRTWAFEQKTGEKVVISDSGEFIGGAAPWTLWRLPNFTVTFPCVTVVNGLFSALVFIGLISDHEVGKVTGKSRFLRVGLGVKS